MGRRWEAWRQPAGRAGSLRDDQKRPRMMCAPHRALAARARAARRRARALAAAAVWPEACWRRRQNGQAHAQAAASRPPRCPRCSAAPRPFTPRQKCRLGQQTARACGQGLAKAEISGRGWRRDGLALIKQQRSLRRTGWTCNRKTPENPAAAGNKDRPYRNETRRAKRIEKHRRPPG